MQIKRTLVNKKMDKINGPIPPFSKVYQKRRFLGLAGSYHLDEELETLQVVTVAESDPRKLDGQEIPWENVHTLPPEVAQVDPDGRTHYVCEIDHE